MSLSKRWEAVCALQEHPDADVIHFFQIARRSRLRAMFFNLAQGCWGRSSASVVFPAQLPVAEVSVTAFVRFEDSTGALCEHVFGRNASRPLDRNGRLHIWSDAAGSVHSESVVHAPNSVVHCTKLNCIITARSCSSSSWLDQFCLATQQWSTIAHIRDVRRLLLCVVLDTRFVVTFAHVCLSLPGELSAQYLIFDICRRRWCSLPLRRLRGGPQQWGGVPVMIKARKDWRDVLVAGYMRLFSLRQVVAVIVAVVLLFYRGTQAMIYVNPSENRVDQSFAGEIHQVIGEAFEQKLWWDGAKGIWWKSRRPIC